MSLFVILSVPLLAAVASWLPLGRRLAPASTLLGCGIVLAVSGLDVLSVAD
jgi:hypothetical protein